MKWLNMSFDIVFNCVFVFVSQVDCVNYVKILHHYNRTHLFACGTGAFHPTCAFVEVGQKFEVWTDINAHTHTHIQPPSHKQTNTTKL